MFNPPNNFPQILWPTIYPPHGSVMLSLQFQLEQSQWWEPEKIDLYQLQQLSRVVSHAMHSVPFYQKKYDGFSTKKGLLLSKETFLSLPTVTRTEIQSAGKLLISNDLPVQHGKMNDVSTSGSTGKTVNLKGTNITALFWQVNTLRDHLWHKRDFSKTLAVIRCFDKKSSSQVKTMSNWGSATEVVTQTGKAYALDIRNSIDVQFDFIQEKKPDYLLTYPSNALALAEYCCSQQMTFSPLLELRTFGETLSDSTRLYCETAFNTKVVDLYSCQEAGYIALQCPENKHYHIQSESVFVEILNDENLHCLPGEIGRVVISSLNNFATPLIRYEIGDFAEVGSRCSCGRGQLVLKKILGRARNLLSYPDGRKNWPVFGVKQFDTIVKIKQFQFIQKTTQDLIMKLVVDNPLTGEQEDRLRTHILQSLGYGFKLDFQYQEEIKRSSSGKFEDFISEV